MDRTIAVGIDTDQKIAGGFQVASRQAAISRASQHVKQRISLVGQDEFDPGLMGGCVLLEDLGEFLLTDLSILVAIDHFERE